MEVRGQAYGHADLRIFKSKWFVKFARKEGIADAKLCEAARRAETGAIDADYGGGVIKQRIARPNEGKSGGYRSIVLFRLGERAFFVHGFAKNDQDSINERQERFFKGLAKTLLNLSDDAIEELLKNEHFTEVICNEKN